MWSYPWTHVGTPSHLGHMDQVAATMPSQAHAGAAQEAPDIGQWEGQDVPLVRPSSCNVKCGIPSSRRYLPTYLGERLYRDQHHFNMKPRVPDPGGKNFQFTYAELEVDEDNQFTEEHEYNASKIVGYRPAPDVPGGYKFRTQTEGFGRTQDSWEPAAQFVPRYT